jgi:hypothetical protein
VSHVLVTSNLLPLRTLLIGRSLFQGEASRDDDCQHQLATIQQQLDAMLEEHGDEEGLLAEVVEGGGGASGAGLGTVQHARLG